MTRVDVLLVISIMQFDVLQVIDS